MGSESGVATELHRSSVLRELALMDTAPEPAFDDLTALAARLCTAPMALITVVDGDRLWFKSRFGVTVCETDRNLSFCAETVQRPGLLVVPDAVRDARFSNHPMVCGPPGIRFYAGAPLITAAGIAVGTLCVLDLVPRALDPVHLGDLALLGRQVVNQLELRRRNQVRAETRESVRRFRALFDHSPVAIGLSDESGRWIETNAAFGRLLGVEPGQMVGRSALDFAHPDDHHIITGSELGQLASPDRVLRAEVRFRQPDGSIRWALVNVTPTPGPNGEQWTLGVAQDITARKHTEDALRRSEEELAAIAAVARCVQSGTDPRPVVVASVRALSGASTVRLLEPAASGLMQVSAGDGAGADKLGMADVVRRSGRSVLLPADASPAAPGAADGVDATPGPALWQPVVVEGEVIAVLHVVWAGPDPGVPGRAMRAVRIMADEAGASLHAAQLRTELERSAATDPLTGALNRRAWGTRLGDLMTRCLADAVPLAVALIDLDNFKSFNDSFGHAAGDDLLLTFSVRVRSSLGSGDLFARWGGEEFILALAGYDSAAAAAVLDRIRAAVPGGQTCSVGSTLWQAPETMATCVGRADAALYAAKAAGRDRVVTG